MPASFLESLARKTTGNLHNEYPAYFVKVGWDTTTINERPTNIAMLLLTNGDGGIESLRPALMPCISSTSHLLSDV